MILALGQQQSSILNCEFFVPEVIKYYPIQIVIHSNIDMINFVDTAL